VCVLFKELDVAVLIDTWFGPRKAPEVENHPAKEQINSYNGFKGG
jgi:hypothetical protein